MALFVFQIVISVLLIVVVLMQNRGAGLGAAWGNLGMSYHSKRGFEQLLSRATVVLATLFMITSLATALVPAS